MLKEKVGIIMGLQIEYIPIADLKPYERNARTHEKLDISNIKTSIEKFGFCDPIGIWSDKNIIVEGHGRLLAAKELGMKEVPCIRLDHLDSKQRREYAIAHNATAELSKWDNDILNYELPELDFSEFDFDLIQDEQKSAYIKEKELKPFKKGHYLITYDINIHDKLINIINDLSQMEGIEVEGSLN